MNLHISTLAERVSDFFKDSFDYVKYAAASATGAAVIALSSGAAAQAPFTAPAPAPVAAVSPPRRYLGTELQQKVDAFKEICANPTYMGWLTRYAVSCVGVDEEQIKLQLKTPVGHPDNQERRQWELYKFGDVVDNFDFLINAETKNIMAQAVADVHNNAVHAQNRNAPASNLLDPTLINIVSAGANGVGGSRFEVVYDINRHRERYQTVGATVRSRVKQRYGHNTPVWKHQETLVLDVRLLEHMNVQAIRARIDREQAQQTSLFEMYGTPGTVVFEKVDPKTGNVINVVEAKNQAFELPPGVYIARSKDARNFTPFVDINGDGQTDLGSAFDFLSGWQGTVRVQNQYTGAPVSPDVRRSLENEGIYVVRVAPVTSSAAPAYGTAPAPGAGTPPLAAPPAKPPAQQPPVSPPPAAPPLTPPAQVSPTLLQLIDAEAAGMFARLGPHFNVAVMPGYGILSLEQQFNESGYEARSSATGPSIAGAVGGIIGEGNGLALLFDFDYFRISNGNGAVEKAGNNVGAFTYDGSWGTMAAEVAYVRLLSDNRNEPERTASRRNLYAGIRAERASANIDGTNITANEQTTDALLAVIGLDHAYASFDGVDHAVRVRAGAGLNSQSNTSGVDYDAGLAARIAADYLARFGEIELTADAGGSYNTMSTSTHRQEQRRNAGTHRQEQRRNEISLAARLGGSYVFGDERQHRAGIGISHRTLSADNSANGTTQVSEEHGDTRLQIIADFAF